MGNIFADFVAAITLAFQIMWVALAAFLAPLFGG